MSESQVLSRESPLRRVFVEFVILALRGATPAAVAVLLLDAVRVDWIIGERKEFCYLYLVIADYNPYYRET